MAYNYQYSKPFSQNGAPVAAVDLRKDLIGVSVPTTVSATAPWGHISKDKTLEAFQKYFFAEVKLDGIGTYEIFKEGGGIIGAGTAADPLRVDPEWMTDRYMPAFNFPISQVGDPSDFLLPISGSYFSVTYPLGGVPYHATAFVEGNGDLRILHHVSNGEELRPVYALWKDYRNTPATNVLITDVVYRPPGLDANEYIHNVHPASESAMIAAVFRETNFQEHILVLLSGTLSAKYHQIVRLGHQVFTAMFGTTFNVADLRRIDSTSINAIVGADGKIYLGMMLFPNNPQNGAISSMVVARCDIDAAGKATLVPLSNTKTTNHVGGVTDNAGNSFIIHQKHATTDRSTDKDAMLITSPGITWYPGAGYTGYGVSPPQSCNFGGLTSDGKIVVAIRHYHWCTAAGGTRALKPIFYYLLDPVARTLTAIPDSEGNQEWGVVTDANNALQVITGGKAYYTGHYTAGGSIYQLMPDGSRLVHVTPGGADVGHTIYVYNGFDVNDALTAAKDSQFTTSRSLARNLDITPPTPLLANRACWMMYNNVMANDGPANGNNTNRQVVRAKLIGSPTDKVYRLLQAQPEAPPIEKNGYILNNDRTLCTGRLNGAPFAVVKGSSLYYHTAYWCEGLTEDLHYGQYGFDDLQANGKKIYLAQSIMTQMDNLKNDVVLPDSNYPNIHNYHWGIIGPYPGVGPQRCLIKYLISWYQDDPSAPPFYKKFTGVYAGISYVPCTIVTDPDGTAHITSLDVAAITKTPQIFLSAHYNIHSGAANLGLMGGVFQIKENDDVSILWCSGANTGTVGGTGFEGRNANTAGFTATGEKLWWTSAMGIGINKPTWHPTLGLGYVNPLGGLGATYEFVPLTDRGILDTERQQYVLTSARPAAGFAMTVSADIPVYVRGALKYIRTQILDLRDTKADARWSTFYLTAAVSSSDDAELIVTLNPPVDTENYIYLGKIVTNETEITEMILEPVTRWENKRTSTDPVGSSIIVSTGFPGAPGEITAISAGIDPTRYQGDATFDTAAKTVTIQNSGSFYIQDKALAMERFGDFEQIYISVGVDKGRCWINGVEVWKGKGQSSLVINRNDLLRDGWNTVAINAGVLTIRGPFLNR